MMNSASNSVATVIAGIMLLRSGAMTASPQATIDLENRYSNVGVIMVWRVDEAGQPIELRGFASGTLIQDRVMVTAGHFTAPAKALGSLPPSIRMFASFNATDAKNPGTWIDVVRVVTHPSMPHCPPPPQVRSNRRNSGCPARARDRRRRTGLPRAGADGYQTGAPGRARDARAIRRNAHHHQSDTEPRRHSSSAHLTRPCGMASGGSGVRRCEGSSTRPGACGRSQAMCALVIPVAAFF